MKIFNILILICLAPFANNLLAQALACNPTANPDQICVGELSQLHANALGGSGSYTYSWTSTPPGFASDLASPVVNPIETTTYTVSVSDGYDFVTGSIVLTVNTRPVPNAGPDMTIPYGTYTYLQGSASSGSGDYSYSWEPVSMLVNPQVQNPATVNLTQTTIFTLTVTDTQTGCVCENTDDMIVLLSGGPLGVYATATPAQICQGNSSQLSANALGGSGMYTFYWTSDPPGFSSVEENPIVIPFETTTYTVEVNDGYNVATSSVDVIIYTQLTVHASSDFQFCQNGQCDIKVQSTNAGREFTTIWYFQGNPVSSDSIYTVTWAEYGSYAPDYIVFTCVVTDECGNTASDEVSGAFFPVVEISGPQLICLYNEIQLVCSNAQTYQWYYDSYPGTPIPGATNQILYYTPATPGLHTICVSILNDCFEYADTCYTFEVSQLACDMTLNNSYDFNICSNTEFTLEELNAYGGWEWSWIDGGTSHTATGQTIILELTDSGAHVVTVTAYNTNGCYDTLTRTVYVSESHVVNVGPDISVCVFDTVSLDAGNPGSSYLWSTGSTERTINVTTTETEYDMQTISVTVTFPDGCVATDECSIVFSIAACSNDTLAYFGQDSDTLYQYGGSGNCGYISGNNCDLDKIKANYFTDEIKTYNIEKVLIRFGAAAKTSQDEVPVKVGIWAKSAENDMPGNLIDFITVPLSQIVQDVYAGSPTTAVFASPVAVPNDYFIGVFLPLTEGDTVALMTNKDGESEAGIAWTLNAADEWLSYSSDPRFFLRVANAIFPIAKQNNVVIYEPGVSTGEYLIYPNPVDNILHICSLTNHASQSEIFFYDLQGRMILREDFTSPTSLDLQGIDQGIYMLIIREENRVENFKVIVY